MDASALIIARLGMFGTLASGLLAQRSALQVKRLELEKCFLGGVASGVRAASAEA